MSEETNYLSDVIIYESFKMGAFNLIVAPCGSGKTTAAFVTIPDYLKVTPQRSLILVNTVSGEDAFVYDGYAKYYDYVGDAWDWSFKEHEETALPVVMTYALFGAQFKKGEIDLAKYDYIVCDEIHTLNKYIAMSRAKLRRDYPQATPWEINDMLQMTCYTYIAIEAIVHAIKDRQSWVFGLTATPEQLYKYDLSRLGTLVNEVEFSQKVHAYEILQKFEYGEIEPILRALVPENRKRLFFFNTIKEIKHYKQILIECGRAAEGMWSLANEPMDNHQLSTRECVLKEHRLPPDVQDLLINSAYETSITIKDPLVQEAYLHTSNKDMAEQARGRLRQDLEIVGIYNKELKKSGRKKEKLNLPDYLDKIPECFFNVPLGTDEKDDLIRALDFPKKWTTLKKTLLEAGYTVEEKNTGSKRFSIIHKL